MKHGKRHKKGQGDSTTEMPEHLLTELSGQHRDAHDDGSRYKLNSGSRKGSRKELRKQSREAKKKRKQTHHDQKSRLKAKVELRKEIRKEAPAKSSLKPKTSVAPAKVERGGKKLKKRVSFSDTNETMEIPAVPGTRKLSSLVGLGAPPAQPPTKKAKPTAAAAPPKPAKRTTKLEAMLEDTAADPEDEELERLERLLGIKNTRKHKDPVLDFVFKGLQVRDVGQKRRAEDDSDDDEQPPAKRPKTGEASTKPEDQEDEIGYGGSDDDEDADLYAEEGEQESNDEDSMDDGAGAPGEDEQADDVDEDMEDADEESEEEDTDAHGGGASGGVDKDVEDEDDKEIMRLEKLLGLTQKKKKDPLVDYIFKGLSVRKVGPNAPTDDDEEADGGEAEDGEMYMSSDDEGETYAFSDDEDDAAPLPPTSKAGPSAAAKPSGSNAARTAKGKEEESEDDEEGDDSEEEAEPVQEAPAASKYVPPHLREGAGAGNAELTRRVKGLVNRLTEQNIEGIAEEIIKIYEKGSRAVTTETLSRSLLSALTEGARISTKFLLSIAAVLAVAHACIGPEVTASFSVMNAKRLNEIRKSGNAKQATPLVLLLAHLYNFKVITASLIFDYVRDFINNFDAVDIELLLVVLQTCGPQLRADDPLSLKEIILAVQAQAAEKCPAAASLTSSTLKADAVNVEHDEGASPIRVRFMLDMITDIKNNKKRGDEDAAVVRPFQIIMRRLTEKLRGDTAAPPLRLLLADLFREHKVGLWWLGADRDPFETASFRKEPEVEIDDDLMRLAKAQRMSSGVRRSVFAVIMGSEDYVDAFEKLMKLNLKNVQEREIVHVLVDCCLQEKRFNPYYVLLARKLCSHAHSFKITFQFSFWDRFKILGTMGARQVLHLGKLLVELLLNFALSLSILKAVEFERLPREQMPFFRHVFRQLLLNQDEAQVLKVFQRIATQRDLMFLRTGIEHFLSTVLLQEEAPEGDREALLLHKRAIAVRRLLEESALESMVM